MDIPVYLFTGFLDAGKTRFIQETLEDERFDEKCGTLLLVCEEGEIEYNSDKFKCRKVTIKTLEGPEELTSSNLEKLLKECSAKRVVIEYNGMWELSDLYENMPRNWLIYQQLMFCDSQTAEIYNVNMRNLMYDKLKDAELVIFNRVTEDTDKMALHKLVRGVTRKSDIAYEYTDGNVEYDEIKDPLPFDINADIIEIDDRDYAIWYRDLVEESEKYADKTVKFKGTTAVDKRDGSFVIGRHIMTCCADDIAYRGLACTNTVVKPKNHDWFTITAQIVFEKHRLYKGIGPVLHIKTIATAQKPDEEVATFY